MAPLRTSGALARLISKATKFQQKTLPKKKEPAVRPRMRAPPRSRLPDQASGATKHHTRHANNAKLVPSTSLVSYRPTKLFVGGLYVDPAENQGHADLRQKGLEIAFHKYGNPVMGCMGRVRVVAPRGRNFAFVEVYNEEKAYSALQEMKVHYPGISLARKRQPRHSALWCTPARVSDHKSGGGGEKVSSSAWFQGTGHRLGSMGRQHHDYGEMIPAAQDHYSEREQQRRERAIAAEKRAKAMMGAVLIRRLKAQRKQGTVVGRQQPLRGPLSRNTMTWTLR